MDDGLTSPWTGKGSNRIGRLLYIWLSRLSPCLGETPKRDEKSLKAKDLWGKD